MAKKPTTDQEQAPKKFPAVCNNCKFAEPWNDLIYCSLKAPPHFQMDMHHKSRLVQTFNSCSFHQFEQ